MWGSKKIETISGFFDGINFIKKCMDDFFVSFTNALEKTDLDTQKLSIPKIIVIGAESSGKSSLLENIVKCQLFPKNTTFCTKIPIHLIMKKSSVTTIDGYKLFYDGKEICTDKNNIYKEIERIMCTIGDDVDDSNIIRIEIIDDAVIDFEFYDLPGIRAYPPELAQKTTDLAKKYLSMDNVIPICVIPATTPRITSYIPMALIKEFDKESDTVICLTMCDRLQDENIEELLINRIISKTDEYNSETFMGVCGIINRTHKNNCKLSDNDVNEKLWFQNNIYDQMPADYVYKKCLVENLGIDNLVSKLSSSYKKFVCEKWIPDLITDIETNNGVLRKKIGELGFDPTDENYKAVFVKLLCESKDYIIVPASFVNCFETFKNLKMSETIRLTNEFINYDVVEHILSCAFEDQYQNMIFTNSDFNTHQLINVGRFTQLINEITQFLSINVSSFGKSFDASFETLITYDRYTCTPQIFKEKMVRLNISFNEELSICLKNAFESPSVLCDIFPSLVNLEETESIHKRRVQLHEQISKNNKAIQELREIIELNNI